MQRINEDALRKAIIAQHGETLGNLLFESKLTALRKQAEQLEGLERERADANAALAALETTLPSIAPLRKAMDDAYAVWLDACEALERRRVENSAAGSELRARIADITRRIAQGGYPLRQEPWTKLKLPQKPNVESLVDASLRAQANAQRPN